MKINELMTWQWQDYHSFHQSKTNLVIHLVTMPVFVLALLASLYFLLQFNWLAAGLAFMTLLVAFAAQGYGHSLEAKPSIPFASPKQAMQRILLEQIITFPRYLMTGGVTKALNKK